MNVVGGDKLFGYPFPRSPGFNIYGTALGITMVLMVAMTLAYFRAKKTKKGLFLILSLEIIGLLLSLSRITIIGFLVALVLVYVVVNFREKKKLLIKIIPVILVLVVVLLIIIPPQKIIDAFADFRGGSTLWRAKLYNLTLDQAFEKPVFGHGYKPRPEDFPVPIGSHSSFLGVFYKTGFLGLIVFCGFWVGVLWRWWKQKRFVHRDDVLGPIWYYSGVALVAGLIWMLTEDLDAPPVAAFLFFIVVGVIFALDRLKRTKGEE
jgi:O-antigen ligase